MQPESGHGRTLHALEGTAIQATRSCSTIARPNSTSGQDAWLPRADGACVTKCVNMEIAPKAEFESCCTPDLRRLRLPPAEGEWKRTELRVLARTLPLVRPRHDVARRPTPFRRAECLLPRSRLRLYRQRRHQEPQGQSLLLNTTALMSQGWRAWGGTMTRRMICTAACLCDPFCALHALSDPALAYKCISLSIIRLAPRLLRLRAYHRFTLRLRLSYSLLTTHVYF